MPALLIKNTKISDRDSPYHGMLSDVLIDENGIVIKVEPNIQSEGNYREIDADGFFLMPGFFDFRCSSGEPGFEPRETFASLSAAAARAGITGLIINPDTHPCIDSKGIAEFIYRQKDQYPQHFFPIGAITKGMQGRELSELYDLHASGVKAFSDHHHPVQHMNLLLRAMMYASGFGACIIQMPQHIDMGGMTGVHEGSVSTALGMPGIPAISEELAIMNLIGLADEFDLPIHIAGISTMASVKAIKQAKEKGIRITCDVHVMNLFFTDETLKAFKSVYKVIPPLRSESDRTALLDGLREGTIDVICSDHSPKTIEEKRREFDLALCGAATIQHAVSAAWTACRSHLSFEDFHHKFAVNPRKILSIDVPEILSGKKAEFALFHPEKENIVSKEDQKSLSPYNPFAGLSLFGTCSAIICGNRIERFED